MVAPKSHRVVLPGADAALRERRVTIDIKKQPEAELCGLLHQV
jgi:hypothetical protein